METGNMIIACAFESCTNPVIGQCPGYKSSCGRFYCAAHSTDNLCSECASLKAQDDLVTDYMETAARLDKHIDKESGSIVLAIIGFAGICFFVVKGAFGGYLVIGGSIGLIIALLVILIGRRKRFVVERARVSEINQEKPDFAEFYKAWKAEKNKEELKKGLAIAGMVTAGVIAAAFSEGQRKRETRQAVDEELRRHGL